MRGIHRPPVPVTGGFPSQKVSSLMKMKMMVMMMMMMMMMIMIMMIMTTTIILSLSLSIQVSITFESLTHRGRMTYICVHNLTITGPDNGLSPGRRQAIIWTNAGILLIGPLGTDFSEILIEIQTFSFKETHLKMSSGKWRPFCLGLNVLIVYNLSLMT